MFVSTAGHQQAPPPRSGQTKSDLRPVPHPPNCVLARISWRRTPGRSHLWHGSSRHRAGACFPPRRLLHGDPGRTCFRVGNCLWGSSLTPSLRPAVNEAIAQWHLRVKGTFSSRTHIPKRTSGGLAKRGKHNDRPFQALGPMVGEDRDCVVCCRGPAIVLRFRGCIEPPEQSTDRRRSLGRDAFVFVGFAQFHQCFNVGQSVVGLMRRVRPLGDKLCNVRL